MLQMKFLGKYYISRLMNLYIYPEDICREVDFKLYSFVILIAWEIFFQIKYGYIFTWKQTNNMLNKSNSKF